MHRASFVEGIVALIVGLIAVVEGLRLAFQPKAPWMIYDGLGPGLYLFILGVSLLIVAMVHTVIQLRKRVTPQAGKVHPGLSVQLLVMVAALAVYIFLIDLVGYPAASIVFFLLVFRTVGIKSWPLTMVLSLGLATVYYVAFVRLCDLVFPHGFLLG